MAAETQLPASSSRIFEPEKIFCPWSAFPPGPMRLQNVETIVISQNWRLKYEGVGDAVLTEINGINWLDDEIEKLLLNRNELRG